MHVVASDLSGLQEFGIWAGAVAGLGGLALGAATAVRQLRLERRSRPVIEAFEWANPSGAPPMPDQVRGYAKSGDPVTGTLRVFGHGRGTAIPDLWVPSAGSVVLLARTIQWASVGDQSVAVGTHGWISDDCPVPAEPPADAEVGKSGLWTGHSGEQPVFWSAESEPNHLIDIAYTVQEWRPAP